MSFTELLDAIDRYVEIKRAGILDGRHENAKCDLMIAFDEYIDDRIKAGLSQYELEKTRKRLEASLNSLNAPDDSTDG